MNWRLLVNAALTASLLWISPAWAEEVMYVTDRLLADVHAGPEAGGSLLARLPTGSQVTVLEQQGRYSKVRLGDGTEGWMKSPKLQKQRPAQVLLLALGEQQERMAGELQQLKGQLAKLRSRKAERIVPRIIGREISLWGALAVVILLVLFGFVLGVLWLDHRIRERHGGFRV